MNTQTHHAIPTFPLGFHYKSETEATERAKEYSLEFPDQFIYVILSTSSGKYRHDYIGLKYSDEKIIATFKQGEKTL
jgi:hypothetical protein